MKLLVDQMNSILRNLEIVPAKSKKLLKEQLQKIITQKTEAYLIALKISHCRSVSDITTFYKMENKVDLSLGLPQSIVYQQPNEPVTPTNPIIEPSIEILSIQNQMSKTPSIDDQMINFSSIDHKSPEQQSYIQSLESVPPIEHYTELIELKTISSISSIDDTSQVVLESQPVESLEIKSVNDSNQSQNIPVGTMESNNTPLVMAMESNNTPLVTAMETNNTPLVKAMESPPNLSKTKTDKFESRSMKREEKSLSNNSPMKKRKIESKGRFHQMKITHYFT